MNQQILERLIWKDARTIAPLAIAIGIGIAGINFLLLILAHTHVIPVSGRADLSLSLCVLLPNLMAFGSGGMLIGTEEENGSLAWLRTLPASWRSIATSKLLVSSACVLLAWLLSGVGLMSQRYLAQDVLVGNSLHQSEYSEWFFLIAGNIAFGFGLLLCGFLTAYLFRSPISALLAVLPIATALTVCFFWIGDELIDWYAPHPRPVNFESISWLIHSVLAAVILGPLYLACRWAAKRRLSGPELSSNPVLKLDQSIEAFRPPSSAPRSWYAVSLTRQRPTPIKALLWQSFRQQGWLLVALTLIAAISVSSFAVMNLHRYSGPISILLPIMTSVCLFVIASLTFYGDSTKKRCVFLADRGVSPMLVWLTRVLPSLLAVSLVAFCYWSSASTIGQHRSAFIELTLLMMVGGFALCQLVSQWSPRPILAFFAGPPVFYGVIVLFVPLGFAYGELPSFLLAALWVSVPIFLFASYCLTPRWMRGRIDKHYTFRCLGFIAAAVVLPYVLVIAGRWGTMPSLDAQWHNQMLAFEFPERPEGQKPISHFLSEEGFRPQNTPPESPVKLATARETEKFAREMSATTMIGNELSVTEVFRHMGYHRAGQVLLAKGGAYPYFVPQSIPQKDVKAFLEDAYERDIRAFKLLLKWSNAVRMEATHGSSNLERLTSNAERTEGKVARIIHEYIEEYGSNPEIAEVIELFPDQDFVEESRINCITIEWQRMRKTEQETRLFQTNVGRKRAWLFKFESERAMRLIDRDVQKAIAYLKTDFRSESDFLSLARPRSHKRHSGQLEYLFNEFTHRDNAVAIMLHFAGNAAVKPVAKPVVNDTTKSEPEAKQ